MKIIQIPKKKKGEFRTICVPNSELKSELKLLSTEIDSKISSMEDNGNLDGSVMHGFRIRKSPVTNAWQHVGYSFTLNMDLKDFFDSVKPEQLKGLLPKETIDKVFINGHAMQGLPSSPSVCNMAATKMDNAILKWIKKKNHKVVYTRYADDLSFSFNEKKLYHVIKNYITSTVGKNGFKVNTKKTRLQSSSYGRREITGLMVDDKDVYPTRKFKRKMRATLHQKNLNSYVGMAEWASCKIPKDKTNISSQEKVFDILKSNKRFKMILNNHPIYELDEIRRGDNFIVTNDIAYVFGMTDLADGWNSCYKRNGCNSNAPLFLSQFNISVGLLLSDIQIKYYGVIRNKIKARCIIYTTRDGEKFATGFYGGGNNTSILKKMLTEVGIDIHYKSGKSIINYGRKYTKSVVYNGIRKNSVTMKSGRKLIKLTT